MKIRLGVIGCGDISKSVLTLCKFTPGVNVAALCDIDPAKLKKQSTRFKDAVVYTDYKKLISGSDVDALYIALPHYLHYPALIEAIEHQKHVLCEKPLTCTVKEGTEIVRRAQEQGVKIAVNYQYRYDNNCYNAVMAAKNGLLGKIHYVRCYVAWSRNRDYFSSSPWHGEKAKSGGGTLITQGSHFLDVILWAIESEPENITPFCAGLKFKDYDIEDFCAVQMIMKNGTVIQFASTMAEKVERASAIEIVGEKGSVVYTKSVIGSKVEFYGIKKPGFKAGGFALHPVHRSLKAFLDWVMYDKKHLCSAEESLKVLDVIDKIYEKCEIRT